MNSISRAFVGAALLLSATGAFAKPKSWVQLDVQTNASKYVTGAPIDIVLTAKNISKHTAFLHFTSGQRFDLQLFDAGPVTSAGRHNPVYTWSATRMFNMMVGQAKLLPNQTQTFTAQIGDEQGALVPGRYELRSHLTNSSQIEAEPVEIEVVASPVQLSATLDKTQLKAGQPLAVKITATNTTKESQTLRFGSGQSFDVLITDDEGQPIWSWGANKRFTMALRSVELKPGESKTFDATWNGEALPDFKKIAPGTYSVQAVLTTNPRVYAPPVQIEIN